jgi:hypothetical protein
VPPQLQVSKAYGALIEGPADPDAGVTLRATYVIDPKGIVRQVGEGRGSPCVSEDTAGGGCACASSHGCPVPRPVARAVGQPQVTYNDLPVGRSVDEVLRVIQVRRGRRRRVENMSAHGAPNVVVCPTDSGLTTAVPVVRPGAALCVRDPSTRCPPTLQAFQYHEKHGDVCPEGWKPGASSSAAARPVGTRKRRSTAWSRPRAAADDRSSPLLPPRLLSQGPRR